MTERGREINTRKGSRRILHDGEVAEIGGVACINTANGHYYPAQSAITTLLGMGYFRENATGDGTDVEVLIEFFETDKRLHGFDNDSGGGEIFETDAGTEVYWKDSHTVTKTSTNRSKAGRVSHLEGSLVFLEVGSAVTGPTGAGIGEPAQEIALQNGRVSIRLGDARVAASGIAVPAYAADSADGWSLVNSKAIGIRFNNGATPPALAVPVDIPDDLDEAEDATLYALVSKVGATVGDATTMTIGMFNNVEDALHDADSDYGGATSAVDGAAATKTMQLVSLTLLAANLPASTAGVKRAATMTFKPTNATLGTDDFVVHSMWIDYVKKAVA